MKVLTNIQIQECVCVCVRVEKSAPNRLVSPPPTQPSLLLSHHSFHYNDNRIWRIALLLLSELGWWCPCPHCSPRLTCWLPDSYTIWQRPPLKSKGSHLVQGYYGLPLYGPLNFILGRLTPQTNRSELQGHGGSAVALNNSFSYFSAWGNLYGHPW